MKKLNMYALKMISISGLILALNSVTAAHDRVVVVPLGGGNRSPSCTAPDEVLSENQCWKDRNLGAIQVATSSTDALAYGDLYQWGRLRDGHQHRTSDSRDANSAFNDPEHGDFLQDNSSTADWRDPQNHNLWQGLGGVNNPCPQGFRVPTSDEWEIERESWSSDDPAGAFASPLKLVVAGYRTLNGVLRNVDSSGIYWSSTVDYPYFYQSRALYFENSTAGVSRNYRASGYSIRCIKD